jgi:hypothetical protein
MRIRNLTTAVLAGAALVASAAPASAGAPVITRGGGTETFADDFILDVCGIETVTTLTEHWTLKEYADGSSTLQVQRTFVSDDPRLPVEKGAGVSFNNADGSRRVVGSPIHLIGPHGTRLLDAGSIWFDAAGEVSRVRGPHPSLAADLAEYYCP